MQDPSPAEAHFARLIAEADDPRAVVAHLLVRVGASLLDVAEQREHDLRSPRRDLARELNLFVERLRGPERQPLTLREEIALLRRRVIRDALSAAKNNVSRAARSLGVSRNLIYDVLRQSKMRL